MKRLLFAFAVVLSTLTVACGKNDPDAEMKAVIVHNMKAMEEEDIDAAMEDLYSGADPTLIRNTRMVTKDLFEKYDLSYKLIDFKVISREENTAVIEVVQETRKIRGPAYQDIRGTIVHTMKKTPDGWKMADSKLVKIEMI